MITGDLVKCNDTGSLGVITRVKLCRHHTKNVSDHHVYQVLWPEGSMTFSSSDDFTPLPDEEYAA